MSPHPKAPSPPPASDRTAGNPPDSETIPNNRTASASDRSAAQSWLRLREAAREVGLTIALVVGREQVEPAFPPASATASAASPSWHKTDQPKASPPETSQPKATTPKAIYPAYRYAVVLGSAGGSFWEQFRAAHPTEPNPADDPLDCHTETVLAPLLDIARQEDPGAEVAYPFSHAHCVVPFLGLVGGYPALAAGPFGVAVHGKHGPWFAWRAAILTAADYPASVLPPRSPCVTCAAPCVAACPTGAVAKAGFRWRTCVEFRLAAPTCQMQCLARTACPVGTESRYPAEAIAYHYGASFRMIRKLGIPPIPPEQEVP